MYQAVDSTDHELAPDRDANPWAAYYFVGFIIIGAFFFLNLFIAVIFANFVKSKKSESQNTMYLRPDQIRWIEIMKLVPKEKPERHYETS